MSDPEPRPRLARTLSELQAELEPGLVYDVVIVGSGYGGSVAAQQLAGLSVADGAGRRPLRVLLLERGREFHAGDFPATFGDLPRELRLGRQNSGEVNGPMGLYDLRLGDDVNALVANGLGGGSLINAGVMLAPRPEDFVDAPPQDPNQPDAQVLHQGWRTLLSELQAKHRFTQARRLLGAEVQRQGAWFENSIARLPRRPAKTRALRALARARGHSTAMPPITVALEDAHNAAGTPLSACNQCGDCMTGCNVGAKDSLDRNLLVQAQQQGCDIVTGATVLSLGRAEAADPAAGSVPGHPNGRHWELRVAHTDSRLQAREAGPLRLRAQRVILAAGALGSTEILLRSRSERLVFSARLGQGFSCNGDNIAAARGLAQPVNGAADEDLPLAQRCVGPTITASVQLQGGGRNFLLQEFAVPGPMKRLFDEIVTTAGTIAKLASGDCQPHAGNQRDPLAVDPEAMARTLLLGVIGHDDASGRLHLALPDTPAGAVPQMGALRICWPDARHGHALTRAHEAVRELVEGTVPAADGPGLVPNPAWKPLPEGLQDLVSQATGPVLTVHPLGGCGIGFGTQPGQRGGVVSALGAVFNGAPGADDWEGELLVLDGSIVPLSLGVNPALTIAALALHAMAHWRQAWQLQPAGAQPLEDPVTNPGCRAKVSAPPCHPGVPPTPRRTEVEVIERLCGPARLARFESGAVVELTLAYQPTALQHLIGAERLRVEVDPLRSHLRLFDQATWNSHHLQAANDDERARHVQLDAPLRGTLRFLHRGDTRPSGRAWRGLWAWLYNRGTRDLWDLCVRDRLARWAGRAPPPPPDDGAGPKRGLGDDWLKFGRLASRAGEIRLFDYDLELGTPTIDRRELAHALQAQPRVTGRKTLTYACRANPWKQLTRLTLTRLAGLAAFSRPVLALDTRFLANQRLPLLRITHQRNHAEALAEMLSLGLYLARVLISVHLWSFRKPDAPLAGMPVREPGPIAGLPAPEIIPLPVDIWPAGAPQAGKPLTIRLTRYARPGGKPLVMIHGYSVSGNTFTHASLAPSAAAYFWDLGRDVWVLDMRTSTALPSATWPWAMEQPALIDIPAALLHVRQATGQRVDVLAHCIGCVMLSMALLADARSIRRGEIELGPDTWLNRKHLDQLAAFNGNAPQGRPHAVVDHVVLSQKGPVLRYSDDNILRAFVMQYLRRWLLTGDYQFRPSADPGVSEQLLDRLLASLPYPDAEFRVENPLLPWALTHWAASRHRMDALYGRDFNAANMAPEVLQAIDDLFGPINLDTVSQTIHFAHWDAITNQAGRGEFVTRGRLKKHWGGIATLAIHGRDNGLVDVFTQQLLTRVLKDAAGVPFEAETFDGMGHQDLLIGKGSRRVFERVESFLRRSQPQPGPALVATEPWIGPRIDAFGATAQGLRLACMCRPDQGRARLWLFPVLHTPAARGAPGAVAWVNAADCPAVRGDLGRSGRWLFAKPEMDLLAAAVPAVTTGVQAGWLALLVHDPEETTAHPSPHWLVDDAAGAGPPGDPGADDGAGAPGGPGGGAGRAPRRGGGPGRRPGGIPTVLPGNAFASTVHLEAAPHLHPQLHSPLDPDEPPLQGAAAPVWQAADLWLQGASAQAVASCFVRLDDLQRSARLASQEGGLHFVLASCQYPSGLLDEKPANASLRALSARPAGTHAAPGSALDSVSLALLLGDQIYADASAGLVDPTRRDELYEQPHERALRLDGMRALLRRVPTQMLLDDHELSDNWEPLPTALRGPGVEEPRRKLLRTRELGVGAYLRYQRMVNWPTEAMLRQPNDLQFKWAGRAFYLLDTRTGRQRGQPGSGHEDWHIANPGQRAALVAWLDLHKHRVKFIATPSLLLPRQRESVGRPRNAALSDAWDGFPASMHWLLQHLYKEKIRNTVFLSGDEHHSLVAEVWLGPEGSDSRVKLLSVHSSALYAPFPFANGRAQDLQMHEVGHDYGLRCEVKSQPARVGDGPALLELVHQGGQHVLKVEFKKADGSASTSFELPLS